MDIYIADIAVKNYKSANCKWLYGLSGNGYRVVRFLHRVYQGNGDVMTD